MTSRAQAGLKQGAAASLMVLALVLGGCGRKSGLDLPPNASVAPAGAPGQAQAQPAPDAAAASQIVNSAGTSDAPRAAPGTKKPFFLDPILN